VLNFYPQAIGIGFLKDGQWTFVPALSEAFFRMLPWLNIVWILGIGLQVMLLRQGRWTTLTRWFDIGLKIAGIVIAYVLLKGPSLILDLIVNDSTTIPLNAFGATTILMLLNQLVEVALIIAIIVGGIEVVKDVYKLLFKNRPRPLVVK
jgi:hypothetical protein